MKRLTQIAQLLLGAASMIVVTLIAAGRLTWRTLRKKHKKLGIAIATVAMLYIALLISGACYNIYNNIFGRYYYDDMMLSEKIELHAFYDDKYRAYDIEQERYTTPKINWVKGEEICDTLAVYALPHKRGYINIYTGEIAIEAQYRHAWVFSEGVAAVAKDGKVGFIDAQNREVIPFKYNYVEGAEYIFRDGVCVMKTPQKKYGVIDREGEWIIEPQYDYIDNSAGTMLVTMKDDYYGVVNKKGEIVYPNDYEYIEISHEGEKFTLTKEGKKWAENSRGEVIEDFIFDFTYWLSYPKGYDEDGEMVEELAEYMKYEIDNRYGIMSRTSGKPITAAIYNDINMLSEDIFEVQECETLNWHIIDTNAQGAER